MTVHATGATLVLYALFRWDFLVPILFANSIVGCVYMFLERDALENVGSVFMGHTIKLTFPQNVAVNVICHVILPLYLYTPAMYSSKTVLTYLIGLLILDIERMYPTTRCDRGVYVAAHATVALLSTLVHAFRI